MKYDYAILCPMKEELGAVLDELMTLKFPKIELDNKVIDSEVIAKAKSLSEISVNLYRNVKDKNPIHILIAKIGIGRAASSFALGNLLQKYSIKKVIVCGVAGACSETLEIGDVVYNAQSRVLDFNLGYNIISGLSTLENEDFPYGEKILYTECEESFFRLFKVKPACIATTDSFVYEDDKKKIAKDLNNFINIAIDMESAHLYYLCRREKIPCIVFRGISDLMIGEAESDFEANLPIASKSAAQATLAYIIDQDEAKCEVLSKIDFIKDFPKKNINFLDIQSILKYPTTVDFLADELVAKICNMENSITKIVALDARGFILGTLLADRLNLPLIMARKKGKLPTECYESAYEKEYGKDIIQIEKSALYQNDRILIADDIAVTFGTVKSVMNCIEQAGATAVGVAIFATISEQEEIKHIKDKVGIDVYSVFDF